MKRMTLWMLAVGMMISAGVAEAAVYCSAPACEGPAQELIERLVLTAGGSIQIDVADKLTPEQIATLNCTLYADHHMVLPATHLSFQEIFAALSTAMITNQKISLRIVDGSSNCEIRYISVYSLQPAP